MKNGIVILNFNDAAVTRNLVTEIQEYITLDYIVIVDNCSTDDSYDELCKLKSKKVHIIKSEKNGGYSYGNNYGIKFIIDNFNAEIIFVSNPDVKFNENVVIEIIDTFKNSEFAMLSGVMLNPDGTKVEEIPTKIPSYYDDVISCFMLLNYLKNKIIKIGLHHIETNLIDVELLPGSFFAIRAKDINAVNYFDEDNFLYCEERTLGRKLIDKGYKIGLLTEVQYIHYHGSSTNKVYKPIHIKKMLNNSKLYYQIKYNKIKSIKKNIFKICIYYSILELEVYLRVKKYFQTINNK